MLSEADKTYLTNKHTGGLSNQKGNTYECYYAVQQIAALLCAYAADLDAVSLQTQVPMTFVDDLLINYPDRKVYHQIKDVKNLTWNSGSSKPLHYDFRGQVQLSRANKEDFQLKLVHSHKNDKLTPLPRGLRRCTTVELFPAYTSLNSLLISDTSFQTSLRNLIYNGKSASLDQLSTLAIHLLGCWNGIDTNSPKTLKVVDDCLSKGVMGYRSTITTTISPEFCEIIERMGGTDYTVSGGLFSFKYNDKNISFPWDEYVQKKIIQSSPTSPVELLNLSF